MDNAHTDHEMTTWRQAREEGQREMMLRELAASLADAVESGDMSANEANEWYNMKADQWAQGAS